MEEGPQYENYIKEGPQHSFHIKDPPQHGQRVEEESSGAAEKTDNGFGPGRASPGMEDSLAVSWVAPDHEAAVSAPHARGPGVH